MIALAIIGIVAAITIPALSVKYKKTVLKTAFFKSYTNYRTATDLALLDTGIENLYKVSNDEYTEVFIPALLKRLNIVKTYTITKYNRFSQVRGYNNYTATYSANSCFSIDSPVENSYAYVLKNGEFLCFRRNSLNNWENINYAMDIDINGAKGPNKYGYDLFEFTITNTLKPYTIASGQYCSKTGEFKSHQSNGRHCAYYALKNKDPEKPNEKYWDNLEF